MGGRLKFEYFCFFLKYCHRNCRTEKANIERKKKFKREFQNIFSSKPLKGVMVRKVVCSFLPNKLQKKNVLKKNFFFKRF